MRAANQTKIFGIGLGVDPKLLVLALVGVAALLFWYNSRSDTVGSAPANRPAEGVLPMPAATAKSRRQSQRQRSTAADRGVLRLPVVSPANGDIDPVLRLGLLERLAKIPMPSGVRNLFEPGPAQSQQALAAVPNRVIPVKEIAAPAVPVTTPTTPQVNIPYKYYGFARPSTPGEANRGFFMEGDDVMVAAEGQVLQQRYLVVQLTPGSAKLEDTQVRLGQTLAVTPEALDQGGNPAFQREGTNPGMMPNPGGMTNQGDSEP